LVDIFAKRLQTQETMTAQIANTLNQALNPKGVAVLIDATHLCMSTRGIHKVNASTVTTTFLGEFKINSNLESRFLKMIEIQSNEC